jgi:hypothetical protein
VPRYFWQDQNSFGLSKTLLTAKFAFGISKTLLAPPTMVWKPQNTGGTVPTLFTPL